MTEWLQLDGKRLNPLQKREIRGVKIDVYLSPYDVPEAVRGFYDESIKRFVIEFKYLGEESKRLQRNKHLELRVGKNSGRLYRIDVDVESLKAEAVSLNMHIPELLSKTIDRLEPATSDLRQDNYDLAKRVISERKEDLFRELACT